ncbi:hypothetical protein AGMMS50225_05360 [Betaproteobacteria bacterium]|nr:hypothetical protein AGMMS50225_05360 [Betaproteobacteria bacterium]
MKFFQQGGGDIGGQREAVAGVIGPEQEARQHAALGGVEARPLGAVCGQFGDVVGEQVVEEGFGVLAFGAQQAKVEQGHGDCAMGQGRAVGGGGGSSGSSVRSGEGVDPGRHDEIRWVG